jgi:hypothetical protein
MMDFTNRNVIVVKFNINLYYKRCSIFKYCLPGEHTATTNMLLVQLQFRPTKSCHTPVAVQKWILGPGVRPSWNFFTMSTVGTWKLVRIIVRDVLKTLTIIDDPYNTLDNGGFGFGIFCFFFLRFLHRSSKLFSLDTCVAEHRTQLCRPTHVYISSHVVSLRAPHTYARWRQSFSPRRTCRYFRMIFFFFWFYYTFPFPMHAIAALFRSRPSYISRTHARERTQVFHPTTTSNKRIFLCVRVEGILGRGRLV